ncbi:hypothetical protein GCM10027033_29670 [Leucobacter ruminantium]
MPVIAPTHGMNTALNGLVRLPQQIGEALDSYECELCSGCPSPRRDAQSRKMTRGEMNLRGEISETPLPVGS